MIHVVEAACEFAPDRSRGTVVIESDGGGPPFDSAFAELTSLAAVTAAQGFAASQGCAPARVNGNKIGPYPVNAAGTPLDQVRGPKGEVLPQTHADMVPVRYRIDVPVSRPIM